MRKSLALIITITLISAPLISSTPSNASPLLINAVDNGHSGKLIQAGKKHKKHKKKLKRKHARNVAAGDHRNKVIIHTKGRKK